MSEGALYLGVDGGGTKTEFVCIDGDGAIVARALTGTTYHLQVGLAGAVAQIEAGVRAICEQVSATPEQLGFTFFGLPAFDEDAVIDPQLEQACARILGHDRFRCGNDMICGWAGSLACEDGINLVAGTGSIAYGERQGLSARAGGWGEVFGDEGSAYWIAREGMNLFSKMSDGRAPRGPLYEMVRARCDIAVDLDLCARIYGVDANARSAFAQLAPIVHDAAMAGDTQAAAIFGRAVDELFQCVVATRRTLNVPDHVAIAVSHTGSVLSGAPMMLDAFRRVLDQSAARFSYQAPRHTPEIGAALYAARLADTPLGNEAIEKLRAAA